MQSANKLQSDGFLLQISYGKKLTDNIKTLENYEIIYIYSGKCVHILNGKTSELTPGEMLIMGEADSHCFLRQQPDTVIISLSVSKEKMAEFIKPYEKDNKETVIKSKLIHLNLFQQHYLSETYGGLVKKAAADQRNCNIILGAVLPMFYLDIISVKKTENNSVPKSFTELVAEMSKPENIRGGIDAMLEISNFSHSHLCRLFKSYMNMSPHQYISALRMDQAFNLIANTDISFENVAEQVGYSSFSHFSLKFKETFGKTPAAIRREYYKNTKD